MDLACQCQISPHPTASISALIIAVELRLLPTDPTSLAMLRISWSPDVSYTDDEATWRLVILFLSPVSALRSHYLDFLHSPERCGVLCHELAKCYARIVNFWLLFLEATPDPVWPDSPHHEECHKIVLANWSRCLSRCVPGDKELICRLRNFALDKAYKEDVERVIAWLEASLQGYRSYSSSLLTFICACCRWTLIYRKMSSFAGKLMALNGIRCVVGCGIGCCPNRATDGGDEGGRCDLHGGSGNGRWREDEELLKLARI